ncbi:MAG TPA: DinB family protein, partial [Blastocatellia bacterium]|nr:DinB family protein [Blastocatellia bacterium]
MQIDGLLNNWKVARETLIAEVMQIPADKFGFRSTPETWSVTQLVTHILGTQRAFVSAFCQPGTNQTLQSVNAEVQRYAAENPSLQKDELIAALESTMKWAEDTIRSYGEDALQEASQFARLEGSKLDKLNFCVAHEMYHGGQVA